MPTFFDNPRDRGYAKSFDGLKIYWEHLGPPITKTSQPILFCYGLACSKFQWRNLAEFYVNDQPCIFFDFRGHHRSESVPQDSQLNMSHLAKDALAVIDQLGIKQTHVFAHSMGCNVAIELAFSRPDLVLSMVLIAGSAENPFQSMLGLKFLDKIVTPILGTFPRNKEYFYTVWSWILKNRALLRLVVLAAGFNRKAVDSRDIETYLDSVADVSPHVFFECLHEMSLGNTKGLLGRIDCPALVISGANDQVTPTNVQRELAAGLKKSQYFSVPLGSHNVQLEFADYLDRKIREFWSQTGVGPTIRKKRETKSDRD